MATPARLFRPSVSLEREPAAAAPWQQAEAAVAARPVPRPVLSAPGEAVELETVIPLHPQSQGPRPQASAAVQHVLSHSHRGWSHSRENLLYLVSAPHGGDFLGQTVNQLLIHVLRLSTNCRSEHVSIS
jgi:hypothetical protein